MDGVSIFWASDKGRRGHGVAFEADDMSTGDSTGYYFEGTDIASESLGWPMVGPKELGGWQE